MQRFIQDVIGSNICPSCESETLKEKRQLEGDLVPESRSLNTHPSQDSSQQRYSFMDGECGCGSKQDPVRQLRVEWGMRLRPEESTSIPA